MKLTTSITLALSLIATVSAQDFALGCDFDSFELKGGHVIKSKCTTKARKGRWTSLDLDKCFVNSNGVIRPRRNGKYSNSCRRCQMNPNRPTWMWCQCKNKSKEWQASEINLNDHIANQDGFLCCGNICGLEYHLTARSKDDDIIIPFDFDFDSETEEAI